ncbi:MAG: hypothetical protein ACTSVI_08290 [Promethearchaeota archaeon]
MRAVALTRFSTIEGPQIHFFISNGFIYEDIKEDISSMLNLSVSNKYFMFRINNITSYNVQFDIKSKLARGNIEMLMFSFITDKFPLKKTERFFLKESEECIQYLKNLENIELIFHLERLGSNSDDELADNVENIYESVVQKFTEILNKANNL